LLLHHHYRALRVLGQGGFGRTLLAVSYANRECNAKSDISGNGSDNDLGKILDNASDNVLDNPSQNSLCVIKQISHAKSQRFQQEVDALKQLGHHPQIPQLIDSFSEKDYFYLVQEWIPGSNLELELAEQGAFSEAQIWQLLDDILPVLNYVHHHHIIHRDLKPENIIRQVDRPLWLVDFGAAKQVNDLDRVQLGTSIGSPEYVAPEQAKGKAVFASDLYSLGVTCIHLLTELSPFELFDVVNNSWVWRSYVHHSVSNSLADILDRLLVSPLNQRFQSVDEVLATIAPLPSTSSTFKAATPLWHCVHTLVGHQASVQAIALSPDGHRLASGSEDKTVRFWELATRRSIATIQVHTQAITAIAFHPDGQRLASASDDKTICIIDGQTCQLIATLIGHQRAVKAIAFTKTALISGSWDKTIKVWNLDTHQVTQTLTGHRLQISAIALSPDGNWLASASYDRTILLWRVDHSWVRPTPKFVLKDHTWAVLSVAFSPDSRVLATGGDDKTIKLWNIETGTLIQTLPGHSWSVVALAFSSDGQALFSASSEGVVKRWQLDDSTEGFLLAIHADSLCAMVLTADSKMMITAGRDRTIQLHTA
jgi:WD40 repeat protein